jgi:hypothetical protein
MLLSVICGGEFWDHLGTSRLSASPDLQQKFLACYNEMENYTVDA